MTVEYHFSNPKIAISRKNREQLENTLSGGDWMVFDLQAAERAIKEYVQETIWSFSPELLEQATKIPAIVFSTLANLADSANSAVLAILEDRYSLKEFVKDVIALDGRGQFLATYDSNEVVMKVGKYAFYCYRVG